MAKRIPQQIDVDDALTKDLCRLDPIYDYMADCADQLRQRFHGNPNVFFYVKGSAALARYLLAAGIAPPRVQQYCARSDWDTQLVINPLLSAKQWFTVFTEVVTALVEELRRFENGLLPLFAGFLPSGRDAAPEALADPGDRAAKNRLAQGLRGDVGELFGGLFLETSRRERFAEPDTPKHWNLEWDNIRRLDVDDSRKNILDLEIQAHNQATLTWSLVHPGQALANLHSVVEAIELRQLKEDTEEAADEVWEALDAAADGYETLKCRLILDSAPATTYLQGQVRESLKDAGFVRSLPSAAFDGPINAMAVEDRQRMGDLWRQVQEARQQESDAVEAHGADRGNTEKEDLADAAREKRIGLENGFGWLLLAGLASNPEARRLLDEWCQRAVFDDPERLARFADEHHEGLMEQLTEDEVRQLGELEDRIDRQFDQYHEELDPEEVAEAEKRMVERFAPFTLVEQQKGGLRIGSVLENLTIRDFYLYRLMIRCQVSNKNEDLQLIPQAPDDVEFDVFKQQFKFRAELLDVSVPRHDSLETAEQWAHVRPQIAPDDDGIPLPKGDYFIDEYVLMFREVLDKKSSSAHKFSKRLWRACLIAEALVHELQTAGTWEERRNAVTHCYPNLDARLADPTPGAIVLMRMCEQLIESHDLTVNEKLRMDTAVIMTAMEKELNRIFAQPLTDQTFLKFMELFEHLGRVIYHHTFMLADYRRQVISDDDLLSKAQAIRDAIAESFKHDNLPYRCAVVEDFAIVAEPDLPDTLKQTLPCDAVTLVVYTSRAGAELLERLPEIVGPIVLPEAEGPVMDLTKHGGTLYVRVTVPVTDPQPIADPGLAVMMRIQCVVDDNVGNWLAPGHVHDLNGILGHYRRTLPKYSEYYALTQRKRVLQELELALTTY